MRSILDYVSDDLKDFNEEPFSEVDAAVLCQVSYLESEQYVPGLYDNEEGISFDDLYKEAKLDILTNGIFDPEKNKKFIIALAKSKRFSCVRINKFHSVYSVKDKHQFCAMTFEINGINVVTFRGTDMTITGWHEDFDMLYTEEIPAQNTACKYLKKVASMTEGPIIVCGHSKGGNLAIYSCMKSDNFIKDRIINIYDFDGPGFRDDIYQYDAYLSIKDKVIRRICDKSIVGMLLCYSKDYELVKTSSISIFRHFLFNWHINNSGTFRKAQKLDMYSILIANTVTLYMEMADLDERKEFVDLLFYLLKENPDLNILDIRYHFHEYTKSVVHQYEALEHDKQEKVKWHYKRVRKAFLQAIKKGIADGRVATKKRLEAKGIKFSK